MAETKKTSLRDLPVCFPSVHNPPVSFLHFPSGRLLFSTTVAKLLSYPTARRRNTQTFKERVPYSCISGGSYQKERRTSKQIKGEAPSKIFILCDAPLTHWQNIVDDPRNSSRTNHTPPTTHRQSRYREKPHGKTRTNGTTAIESVQISSKRNYEPLTPNWI